MQSDLTQWLTREAAQRGLALTDATPMRVEASTRSFYRASLSDTDGNRHSWVVMNSPPATEKNDRFLIVQRVFATAGLGVPELIASHPDEGWFVLSDLGQRHFEEIYAEGHAEQALRTAIDALVRLQGIDSAEIEPYPRQRFIDELGIFTEWFVGHLACDTLPTTLESVFEHLVANDVGQPQCCIHLDYHCRNLLLGADQQLGIVDFQDAMIGPATYDLASLLKDCYHQFDADTVRRWQRYYLSVCTVDFSSVDFERTFDLTALQRQLKAVGIFARMCLRDGKATHLRYIEPVLDAICETADQYPETRPLGQWIADRLPDWQQRMARS